MKNAFLLIAAGLSSASAASNSSYCPVEINESSLLFNAGSFSSSDVGLPGGSPDVSLATAICCDLTLSKYAEPNGFYSDPTVRLFTRVSSTGLNTFYDSACDLPVYQAPVGRTFEEWKADTEEHGWPAFRGDEIITKNVVVGEDGHSLFSKCGTKLGTIETDETGSRHCIDLVCISGKAQ